MVSTLNIQAHVSKTYFPKPYLGPRPHSIRVMFLISACLMESVALSSKCLLVIIQITRLYIWRRTPGLARSMSLAGAADPGLGPSWAWSQARSGSGPRPGPTALDPEPGPSNEGWIRQWNADDTPNPKMECKGNADGICYNISSNKKGPIEILLRSIHPENRQTIRKVIYDITISY